MQELRFVCQVVAARALFLNGRVIAAFIQVISNVPNPKFAISVATKGRASFGFERTLENYDSSVGFGSEVLLKVSRQK